MERRCTWRETPKGHWICEHGAYAAVVEVDFDVIQVRITLPDDTVIAFQADEDILPFATLAAEQRMVREATAAPPSVGAAISVIVREHRPHA